MKRILIMYSALIVMISVSANAGNETGSGGDPLSILFEEARGYTVERIQNAKECSFNVDVRSEVVSWIMQHKSELASDVKNSQHVWTTDQRSTCAFTQPAVANADIIFSFDACRPGIKDVRDAILNLAHESSHHLGIKDEKFADEIGKAIARLGLTASCSMTPAADPFDPNSCPGRGITTGELMGMIGVPDHNWIKLGRFNVFARERKCYGPNYCGNWYFIDPFPAQLGGNGWNAFGDVTLMLQNDILQIMARSDHKPAGEYKGLMSWGARSIIKGNGELTSEKVGLIDVYKLDISDFPIEVGRTDTNLHGAPMRNLSGVMTKNCLRQTTSLSTVSRDGAGNSYSIDHDVVLLSTFTLTP